MRGGIAKKGKNFYVYLWIGGKKKWFSGAGSSKKKAETILNEKVYEVQSGTYQEIKKTRFKEYALQWLEHYAKGKVRDTTYTSYEGIIKNHLNPVFGELWLSRITAMMMQKYITDRLQGRKAKTVVNEVVVLKEMFKHAVRWGYLKFNPAEYLERPRVEKEEMQILTPKEIKRWIEATDPEYKVLFKTALFTGMRKGELMAVQRTDIDTKNNQINITKQIQKGRFVPPKTKASVRKIDIDPALTLELKKYMLSRPINEMGLVFCNSVGKPIDYDNMIKRYYQPALKKAKVKKIRFHDLRHTYVALKLAQRDDMYYISRQLGHSSIKTTFDLYGHLQKTVHTERALRVSEILG